MVQILEANPTKRPSFLDSLFGGMARGVEPAVEKFSEQMKLNRENEALQKQYGINLQGIQDPTMRHQIAQDELAFARKMKQAKATQNVQYGRKAAQAAQEIPSGPQGTAGKNFPQPQTTGQIIPLMTPDQIIEEGQRYAAERNAAGVPTSVEEGLAFASAQNQEIAKFNQFVAADVEAKKGAQIDYGQQSVDKLLKLYPQATDEQQAIFRKMGENEAYEGMSEADMNKSMAQQATKFKNTISSVRDTVSPKRLFSGLKQEFLGTGREAEKERNSVRIQVKPLLDMGLYDTARSLLADKGYYPEERESIVSTLGEGPTKSLASMPKIVAKKESIPIGMIGGGPVKTFKEIPYTESQKETFSNNLSDVIKSDPTVNLILLRKAYEDKGVRWDLYKDAIDAAIINGHLNLNDEQYKQLNFIESPPLNNLEIILHKLGLMGK